MRLDGPGRHRHAGMAQHADRRGVDDAGHGSGGRSGSVASVAALGAEARDEVGAELAGARRIAVVDPRAGLRPGPSARRPRRAPRRRRPAAATGLPRTQSAPSASTKARRKPERSVLWPVVRPFLSNTTVLTAPISRRFGRHLVEQGDHRFLERIGDVDAGEARRARRGQQIFEPRGPAGCRCPSGGSGRPCRRRRRRPRAAPATASRRYWRRSGRPACVTSWPCLRRRREAAAQEELGDARIGQDVGGRVLDAGLALLQHQAVVGDGQRLAGVLLDQQDR